MGFPMSSNLATWLHSNSLPPLTLWNRTASKLPPVSDSIKHASSLRELARTCDIVITSLANDDAAKEIYAELFEGAKDKAKEAEEKNTIFVETSTLYPTTSGECSALMAGRSAKMLIGLPTGELERQASAIKHTFYLQAPVFGPPPVVRSFALLLKLFMILTHLSFPTGRRR
jgi:hypothetical protein